MRAPRLIEKLLRRMQRVFTKQGRRNWELMKRLLSTYSVNGVRRIWLPSVLITMTCMAIHWRRYLEHFFISLFKFILSWRYFSGAYSIWIYQAVKNETSGAFEHALLTIIQCAVNPGKYFAKVFHCTATVGNCFL